MTPEIAAFLRDLLTAQQIAVGAPDFADTTRLALTALDQLNAIIEES